jgi:tetratricopeptide (TPR) repeat protein
VVKFSDRKQQQKLFYVLIVELVAGCVSFFLGWIRFDATNAQHEIVQDELAIRRKAFEERLTNARAKFASNDLVSAYDQANLLFTSQELTAYFPIRDLFVLTGDIAKKRELWTEAAEFYGPALKLDPNNVSVLTDSGEAYRYLQRFEEAEELYLKARSLKGQDWTVLNGSLNCARRYAAFFIDSNPKLSNVKFEQAVELADDARRVALTPEQGRISDLNKARVFWEWRKYSVASAMYDDLLAKYPEDPEIQEDMAAVLIEAEKPNEAFTLYMKLYARQKSSGTPSAFVGSGLTEAAAKASIATPADMETAWKAGLLSLSQNPQDPFGYYAVALLAKKAREKL